MNRISTLEGFAARLRGHMSGSIEPLEFNELALELCALQFEHNWPYRKFCESRWLSPGKIRLWQEIPAVPTLAFKELELSCIPAGERSAVFFSSGTTVHRPSRHFHSHKSLEIYEASLLAWFRAHLLPNTQERSAGLASHGKGNESGEGRSVLSVVALTPPKVDAPHSSLAHMFETLRRHLRFSKFSFTGTTTEDGAWILDCAATIARLQEAIIANEPVMLLGTAFSYVHLLDHMAQRNFALQLPAGSRVLETGGYKGRSRALPKSELHSLIASRLGVPPSQIVCEYGMSELSSQSYDRLAGSEKQHGELGPNELSVMRCFRFPPWVGVQIVSPETGQEVEEGQTGLIRVFDLANIYSVMAIQTEDLAVRRGNGFELIGRAALAEARGCSLMTH
jgi:acyl-protein synthetase LuxE